MLCLSNLNINGLTVVRESSIKFLGVKTDENLTLRDHIKLQKILDSYIKESINSVRIASSKSTLVAYILI